MKKVRVQIVSYNSGPGIEHCLNSVLNQTYGHVEIVVYDNGSSDLTPQFIRQRFPAVEMKEWSANLGFARAHNLGFTAARDADYVMVLNDDATLEPTCIAALVQSAGDYPSDGSFQPKLLNPGTDQIDTTGICIQRNRVMYDRGQGEIDRGQYDEKPHIFAANGAAPLYRREMLEDVKLGLEYFDEDYFAYKEDVDLGWRARLLGWSARFVPGAQGYHQRGWSQTTPRSQINPLIRRHSLKNRYLTLLKNDCPWHSPGHLCALLGREVRVACGVLLFEPFLLSAYWQALILAPKALGKRRSLLKRVRVHPDEVIQWFT